MDKNENQRARRAALRAMKRCAHCGKQDAFTLNGRYYCAECVEWRKNYCHKRLQDDEYREHLNEKQREWYYNCKAKGICANCGRKADAQHVFCARCRALKANRQKQRKAEKYIDPDMCSQCHKLPCLPGRKICANCYIRGLKLSRMGIAARKGRSKNAAASDG